MECLGDGIYKNLYHRSDGCLGESVLSSALSSCTQSARIRETARSVSGSPGPGADCFIRHCGASGL